VVGAPVESESGAPPVLRDRIHDKRVSRGRSDSLSGPVGEADDQHLEGGCHEGQKRPHRRSEAIAPYDQKLPPACSVGEESATQFREGGGALGDSLHHSKKSGSRSQDTNQEEGKKGIGHLAGGVVEERRPRQ
jgi:hypothetical protein